VARFELSSGIWVGAVPVSLGVFQESRGILLAGRELDEAVSAGEEGIATYQQQLLNAALAWEAGGVVAGFEASDDEKARSSEEILEDELSEALVELEIGNVLLAGSAVTETAEPAGSAALANAVDGLAAARQAAGPQPSSTIRAFKGKDTKSPQDFFVALSQFEADVVARTTGVVKHALSGLGGIPASQVQSVLRGVASAMPDLGALIQAGLRAVRRAVDKLTRLVPDALHSTVGDWAKKWWGAHGAEQIDAAVRRALSVDALDREIAGVFRPGGQLPRAERLQGGSDELAALDERHARLAKTIERIVSALGQALGPLAALFPAAAAWIYVSGGSGLLAAAGIAIWVGRDYLDSEVPFARVAGVRSILATTVGP
jgi:hypothetical protein